MDNVQMVRVEDSCVIRIKYPDEGEITLQLAREVTSEVYRRFGTEKIGLVHIAGRDTTVGEGVREFLAGKSGSRNKIAEAFVVQNLNQRILGNFYLRVGRPVCPSEVFTLEEDAVKWVKMYCPHQKGGQAKKNSASENTGVVQGLTTPVQNFGAN